VPKPPADRPAPPALSPPAPGLSRRGFLRGAAGMAASGIAMGGLFEALTARSAGAAALGPSPYGPLQASLDRTTGLPLLRLPAGFSYATISWTGDPLEDGRPTPDRFDGMAAFRGAAGRAWLVRNHERFSMSGSFAPPAASYDPLCDGGTTTLEVDLLRGRVLRAFGSLSGTMVNCAGGATPWGSWLSCEEIVLPAAPGLFAEPHGYVFEVPAGGLGNPAPLRALGRFKHEAVGIDASTGIAYLTEDEGTAGLYRFVPNVPGDLAAGGSLTMLAIAGAPAYDTRKGQTVGAWLPVTWAPIGDPDPVDMGVTGTVYQQGRAAGGATFARLEGVCVRQGRVFFAATTGGDVGQGQIFELDPAGARMRLVYESPASSEVSNPDNLTVSPRGGLVLCEDGSGSSRLHGITLDGRVFPFAQSQLVLDGVRGFTGDFSGSEFCGACYDPFGKWLFVNVQEPGVTFAITGPWARGAL